MDVARSRTFRAKTGTEGKSPGINPREEQEMNIMGSIAENLRAVEKRIALACSRVGRPPGDVKLVGVTKTVPTERIREGVKAGIAILGENYVQEARAKIDALSDLPVTWHFIGHLQSNKAKVAVDCFDLIHSVDRISLAKELDRQAQKRGKALSVLVQVNLGDEETKSGVSPEGALELAQAVGGMDALRLRGLMALPPYLEDPEDVRPYFQSLRRLLERLKSEYSKPDDLTELSMGMSHDFDVAVEEGATLVRIGTALFGARPLSG